MFSTAPPPHAGNPCCLPAHDPQQQAHASSGGGAAPDPPLRLLRRYLDAERLFNGTLGVRLSEAPRPHVLVDLLGSTFLRQAAQAQADEAEAAGQAPP
jgi:hypothetical protein